MKVLFVTQRCPYPFPLNPDQQVRAHRENSLIEALLTEFPTELLCFRQRHGESNPSKDLMPQSLVLSQVYAEPSSLTSRAATTLLRLVDKHLEEPFSQEFADALEVRQTSRILWLSGMTMLPYLPVALESGFIPILDLHHFNPPENFHGIRSLWRLPHRLSQAGYWSLFQKETLSQLAAIVVSHEREKKFLLDTVGSPEYFPKIHVINDCVDKNHYRPLQDKEGSLLLFVLPKDLSLARSSLHWLRQEILPRLLPNLKCQGESLDVSGLRILGPLALKKQWGDALKSQGIDWISDRTLHLNSTAGPIAESKIVVFPFYSPKSLSPGIADIRLLEAMASGRAVVSTPQATYGFELMPSHDSWISDQPDGLTSSILKLLHSSTLRNATRNAAIQSLESRHETSSMRKQVFDLMNQLDLSHP